MNILQRTACWALPTTRMIFIFITTIIIIVVGPKGAKFIGLRANPPPLAIADRLIFGAIVQGTQEDPPGFDFTCRAHRRPLLRECQGEK